MTPAASARLEFRVRSDRKSMIERAAELAHEPVSEFARTAAEERAARIIEEHEATTTVPVEFFDALLAALDAPAAPNATLARAAGRASELLTRD
ncbi:MAG: DUF1778 domain-containing protein [Sciscionella sp.]